MQGLLFSVMVMVCLLLSVPCHAEWENHEIQLVNGKEGRIKLPAKIQIVTEEWNKKATYESQCEVRMPYIVYMPEKDRLLMLVSRSHPGGAIYSTIITSDDRGTTWGNLIYPYTDSKGNSPWAGQGLTYLGNGRLVFGAPYPAPQDNSRRFFSNDYGQTWNEPLPKEPAPGGGPYWDPYLVDRDPVSGKVTRIWTTGGNGSGTYEPFLWFTHGTQAFLGFSTDEGRTWSEGRFIPEWRGACETSIVRAKNGDMVVTCRPDPLKKFYEGTQSDPDTDHYCGFGISISKDNGETWSKFTDNMIYGWGRHHSSMVVLPNGDIVMTYVVRVGYVDSPDGFPQYGIEAIVSHDNGKTWDLDHKYMLALWKGTIGIKENSPWISFPAPQSTSSVLLPDGTILTAFGTGYRVKLHKEWPFPRDIGLVQWRVSDQKLNSDRTIAEAPFDSETRNTFNPNPDNLSVTYIEDIPETKPKVEWYGVVTID